MSNFLSGEFVSAFIQTLVGVVLTLLFTWSRKIYNFIVTRNVRHFWKPFMAEKLTIFVTEYPVSGKDMLSNIAKIAGSGWLISKGMALSLAHLLDFSESKVTKRRDIIVCGDRTGTLETPNMIVLGSPANNLYSKSMYLHLKNMYDIPYEIIWESDGTQIQIRTISGEIFTPTLEDGIGQDYALVIKANYQNIPQKSLIIIAGCYMWGTKAASEAITDHKILDVVAKDTHKSDNVAFIIKTKIINDSSIGPEIDIQNKRYASDLTV